jgi:hypothetical protein
LGEAGFGQGADRMFRQAVRSATLR